MTNTIKKCNAKGIIEETLDRTVLWEMQTPQGMKRDLFFESFDYVHQHHLNVTDDLAMCELIWKKGEIVPSSPQNFKITTPFDLAVAETLCATK